MKNFLIVTLLIGFVAVMAGCGGGGSSNPSYNVEGSWRGTVEWEGAANVIRLDIIQTGSTLSATSTNEGTSDTHTFAGTISGGTIYLVSVEGVNKREYNLTVATETTISGTYTGTNTLSDATATTPATFNKIS